MVSNKVVLLISSLLAFRVRAGSTCDAPEPIVVKIGNATTSQTEVTRWGLKAEIGTPKQSIVIQPNPEWNHTTLWKDLKCGGWQEGTCAWDRGDSFDDRKSDSWTDNTDPNVFEFSHLDDKRNLAITPWGNDTLFFEPNTTIPDHPIWRTEIGKIPQNALGLGRGSPLLDMLVKQGKIASRSWSLFWGWQGKEKSHQMEGNFVIGGYDKAKTGDEDRAKSTQKLSNNSQCPSGLVAYVTGMRVNHIDGNKTELLGGGGKGTSVCIRPHTPLIFLPEDAHKRFKKAIPGKYLGPSKGMYGAALSYGPKDPFVGNLTITFNTNLSVTIPNHQLVLPNIGISADDHEQTYLNDSHTIMIFNRGNTKSMPSFGQVFLSAAYLHVDHDEEEFTLWEAIPTEKSQIVSVDHTPGNGGGTACDGEPGQPSGSPNATSEDENDDDGGNDGDDNGSEDDSSGISRGAIAGIVVGAVAGALILFVAAFFLYRRRRVWKHQTQLTAHNAAMSATQDPQKVRYMGQGELPSGQEEALMQARESQGRPTELPGDNAFVRP